MYMVAYHYEKTTCGNHMWITCDSHVKLEQEISHVNHMWLFQFHMWTTCGNITCEPHVVVAISHVVHMWYHKWTTCGYSNFTCGPHVVISHVIHMCKYHMWFTCDFKTGGFVTTTCDSYVCASKYMRPWVIYKALHI